MAMGFSIDDSELGNYISSLTGTPQALSNRGAKWVRNMTRYTELHMKRYAKSKTARSTGKLSSSITSEYTISDRYVEGKVFVPPGIKYQFAAEYGIQRRYEISGSPKMTFPVSSWKKARQASGSVTAPNRGYFVFTRVTRGRYKGRHFTQRAFEDLQRYYTANEQKILTDIGNTLIYSR